MVITTRNRNWRSICPSFGSPRKWSSSFKKAVRRRVNFWIVSFIVLHRNMPRTSMNMTMRCASEIAYSNLRAVIPYGLILWSAPWPKNAAAIAGARLSTIDHINHAISASDLSFPKAKMSVEGLVENVLLAGDSAFKCRRKTGRLFALKIERRIEVPGGRFLALTVVKCRLSTVKKTCKLKAAQTGEQKALLLSIVLAQARAGALWHGIIPVILLDEVAAHLDGIRRLELFEEICQIGAQVWMTGTDANLFAGLVGKKHGIFDGSQKW